MKTQDPESHKELDTIQNTGEALSKDSSSISRWAVPPLSSQETAKDAQFSREATQNEPSAQQTTKDELTFSSVFSIALLIIGLILLFVALCIFLNSTAQTNFSPHNYGRYLREMALSYSIAGILFLFASCLLRILLSIARSLQNLSASK